MNGLNELEKAIAEISEIALGFGLDPFSIRYEICPPDIIYTFGAYGMPTRFSHWSFGKAFHRMKLQYDLGLSKIYELVINSNPSYAFLLEGNSMIQNKLIIAHVIAHTDFFKNSAYFRNTSRDMVESMARTAERIRSYENKYGNKEVEEFIDAVLAIQEHIDPSLYYKRANHEDSKKDEKRKKSEYDDLWDLEIKIVEQTTDKKRNKHPIKPEKDIMLFIEENSKALEEWQRDIITMLREEMLYFWPQIETKIMNEGWASYWHTRILRELDLTVEETIEFARLNAAVIQPSRLTINPYHLGNKIFEDIEERWNNPTKVEQEELGRRPGEGRRKIFEVREIDSDISFLRNYLTNKLVDELDLYLYQKKGNDWIIIEKNWEKVRDQIVNSRVNGGYPYIVVEDGDYLDNGELYLKHQFEGTELDIKYLERTLPYIYNLWGRTVHIETMIENREVLFSYDGKKNLRKFL